MKKKMNVNTIIWKMKNFVLKSIIIIFFYLGNGNSNEIYPNTVINLPGMVNTDLKQSILNIVSELWRIPRIRHAEKRYDRMGRSWQIRNGRVHGRGGEIDQRTTSRQTHVNVFGPRGRAHG